MQSVDQGTFMNGQQLRNENYRCQLWQGNLSSDRHWGGLVVGHIAPAEGFLTKRTPVERQANQLTLLQVLPPIGGLKGKRDSKMKTQTFKTAASAIDSDVQTPDITIFWKTLAAVFGRVPEFIRNVACGPHESSVSVNLTT